MNKKELIEKLNYIEENFDVESLIYRNVRIWPAVRAYYQLKPILNSRKKTGFLASFMKEAWNLFYSFLNCFIIDAMKNHSTLKQADLLFLADTEAKVKTAKGTYINKFSETLFSFIARNNSFFYIEYSFKNKLHRSREHSSYFFNFYALRFTLISIFKNKSESFKIENIESFNSFIELKGLNYFRLDVQQFGKRIEKIFRFKSIFIELLEKVQPKAVFYSVYYSNLSLGLTLAANEKSIKTVEIQHGQQGNYHLAYSDWINYPKIKYELHPNYFWMWSETNAERIKNWSKQSSIQVLNGGNPWMNYYFRNVKTKKIKRLSDLKRYQYKILVSMQLLSIFYESLLPEILKTADDSIFWLIRMHPSEKEHTEELVNYLEAIGCQHFEIELSSSLPLYDLFPIIDYNVTFFSTVAYEAVAFGIKNIILHPNGLISMRKYIAEGVFAYPENTSEFFEILKNFNFQVPSERFIEYEDNNIYQSIRKVVESNKA